MEHILLLNSKSQGYNYVSLENEPVREFPRETLKFEESLSKFCELRPNTFSVFFTRRGRYTFFSYGIFFSELQDAYERKGIHFRHVMILSENEPICPVIVNFLKLLELEGREHLFTLLSKIAAKDASIPELRRFLLYTFQTKPSFVPADDFTPESNEPKIKKIVHNVGGLSAYVWLSLARMCSRKPENWYVYEKIENNKVVTETSYEGKEIDVSEFVLNEELNNQEKNAVPTADVSETFVNTLKETIENLEKIVRNVESTDKRARSLKDKPVDTKDKSIDKEFDSIGKTVRIESEEKSILSILFDNRITIFSYILKFAAFIATVYLFFRISGFWK